jgi:hypothetical protein
LPAGAIPRLSSGHEVPALVDERRCPVGSGARHGVSAPNTSGRNSKRIRDVLMTVVVEDVLAFAVLVAAVRVVASIRLRGAGKNKREVADITKTVALALVLTFTLAPRATAAESAVPPASDAHQRQVVVAPRHVELDALGDTSFDEGRFARMDDTVRALAPGDGTRPAVEAELNGLTAATMAENAVHGSVAFAPTW